MKLILDSSKKYLLACSFGPDSMALFSLLLNGKYDFDVAIVNYHLRNESDLEVTRLNDYCKTHNIRIHIKDVQIQIVSNIEEKCREIRYSFFDELNKKFNYDAVLVAHNQDDFIETFFIQEKRNIKPLYYGIKCETWIKNTHIIRPLLDYRKNDLLTYCEENRVPYMIDKTNLEDTFLRNKIRHNIVNKLSNDERKKIIAEIIEKNKKLNVLLKNLEMLDLNSAAILNRLDETALQYALNILLEKEGFACRLGKKQICELKKVLVCKKPNIKFAIKDGVILIKEYDRLSFYKDNAEPNFVYQLKSPGILDTPYFYLDFSEKFENRNIKITDFPLTIRNSLPNDTYVIKGYKKKLKRLFIDWKIPLLLRKKWPVILSKEGDIVYVPRYQKDFVVTDNQNFFVKI